MWNEVWLAIAAGAMAGAASAPHCFAMCGPLSLFAVSGPGSTPSRIARHQLGRLGAYGAVGAVAGTGSGALTALLAPRATAIALAAIVAGAMIFAAIRLVRPAGPTLVKLGRRPRTASVFSRLPREPLWIGAFSALLPCGALYTAVMAAAGAGTWLGGSATMAAFAIVSGLGLVLSAIFGERLRISARGRWILAAILFAGAIGVVLRPILATERGAACHEQAYGCATDAREEGGAP